MGETDSQLLQEIKDQNTRILSYIEDDKMTGRKGLYSMGQDHEQRIKGLETEHVILKTEKKWVKVIGGAIGGALFMIAKYIANLFF